MTATNINVPLISGVITLIRSAIFDAAMTRDNVDVSKKAEATTVFVSYHFLNMNTGKIFEARSATNNNGINSNKFLSLKSDHKSSSTPTITKKMGIKNP